MQKILVPSLFLVLLLSVAESWALPPCPGSYDNNTWTNCEGTYTWPSGSQYVGEWKDSKKHGQGTYTYANGRVAEGIWENDQFLYAQKVTPRKAPTVIADDGKAIAAASGTGFAVTRSGHIVTNHHVINGCNDVKVHYEGKIIPATVLSKDALNDLAVLKADFKPTTILPLSKKNPELMEDVFVAGFPFGKSISSSVKITKGIISSLTGLGDNYSNIQIAAAIQPGNSGGPIFDERGNVVAVAVAKLDLKKVIEHFGTIAENTNFGIKANIVSNLLASNSITPGAPNTKTVSKSKLGKTVSNATYYLSCWMQSQKVIFSDLTQ